MAVESSKRQAQVAAENAIRAICCGYDITNDLRLPYCKETGCLIEVDREAKHDIFIPGGVTIADVPEAIRCDKGERMRFSSGVLSFQGMAEHVNQELNIVGRIPSGIFNAMFELTGSWQKDATGTQHLAYDGWFITLYSVALTKSQIVLQDAVKQEVPTDWDPLALAQFIEKYGTHVITGVKMGGKDVIYVKQQYPSNLKTTEVQKLLKTIADKRFSDANDQFALLSKETSRKDKVVYSLVNVNHLSLVDSNVSTSLSVKEDIIKIYKRRGGLESAQSHQQWITTIPSSPDVISMSFVPITSLLTGVSGTGFLSHAINLYLRFKPPIEELHQFLEFQLPRQWAPAFSESPLGTGPTEDRNASLQFSFMGQKVYVNTSLVSVGRKPVTGARLYLEGKKCNRLAIHLHHISTTPNFLQLSDYEDAEPEESNHKYYEPLQWKSFSHVCTAPIECNGSLVGDPASIVTGAQLEVRLKKRQKILFLKLQFSRVDGAIIRTSEWDYSPNLSQKSGIISMISMSSFSEQKSPKPQPVILNSAIHPDHPSVPVQVPKLSKLVDTTELTKGPQDMPGHWVVTGAKLCVEGGKISLGVKFSLLELNDIL
ncbi:MACPF domain-containing protein At4g24290 isoform X2 [Cryptomeria japonica]|uniref:MACPF domain-containing protein At4g24290 isoform X2 n=1 Tax=Cryptomeria japonica TaxID=3369 RepID=UPI0027DA7276|nr:MACPF domain-containing protein At4g24290 isoform X2 [Cryptomeria japonica]